MTSDDIKEIVRIIGSNSDKIIQMIDAMEHDTPGTPSYKEAVTYIRDLSQKSLNLANHLNNALK